MSNVPNTISLMLSTNAGASVNVPAPASPSTLDPNDQRLLVTLKDSLTLPLAGVATAAGLTPKAAVESINRLQATERVEIIKYDDKAGRYVRLTPQGYSLLAGIPFAS
jgi:hypothetical protein